MPEPAQSLLISACLGALIGLIRQWEEQQGGAETSEFAGVRTFVVVALLGCLGAYTTTEHAAAAFPVALGVLGLLLTVVQYGRPGSRASGYTTPGAALVSFFCGALVYWQARQAAVLVAAMTMVLIGMKGPIHQWTRRFTVQDVRSVLQFAAITGVILPLVPNRGYGPYDAFNPWSIWLMVVLISGLGFLGYLLVRLLGSSAGITLTGLVGGLASSTATTLAFSRRSREDPPRSSSYALAVVLACNVMLGRVLVVIAAIQPALIVRLWPAMLAMALPGLAFAAWMGFGHRQTSDTIEAPPVSNPLSLGMAVKFALLYAAVKFLVTAATELEFARGVLAISAVAGLTDVDAVTVSMADGARQGTLEPHLGATAILIACISNTLVKAGIGAALGSPALRRLILLVLGATAAAGAAAWPFVG